MRALTFILALAGIVNLVPVVMMAIIFSRLTDTGRDFFFVFSAEAGLFVLTVILALIHLHRTGRHLLVKTKLNERPKARMEQELKILFAIKKKYLAIRNTFAEDQRKALDELFT